MEVGEEDEVSESERKTLKPMQGCMANLHSNCQIRLLTGFVCMQHTTSDRYDSTYSRVGVGHRVHIRRIIVSLIGLILLVILRCTLMGQAPFYRLCLGRNGLSPHCPHIIKNISTHLRAHSHTTNAVTTSRCTANRSYISGARGGFTRHIVQSTAEGSTPFAEQPV